MAHILLLRRTCKLSIRQTLGGIVRSATIPANDMFLLQPPLCRLPYSVTKKWVFLGYGRTKFAQMSSGTGFSTPFENVKISPISTLGAGFVEKLKKVGEWCVKCGFTVSFVKSFEYLKSLEGQTLGTACSIAALAIYLISGVGRWIDNFLKFLKKRLLEKKVDEAKVDSKENDSVKGENDKDDKMKKKDEDKMGTRTEELEKRVGKVEGEVIDLHKNGVKLDKNDQIFKRIENVEAGLVKVEKSIESRAITTIIVEHLLAGAAVAFCVLWWVGKPKN